jgi:hypothetical protein
MSESPRSIKASVQGQDGLRLTALDVSLGLVPSIGGRILSLTFRGEEILYAPPLSGSVLPDIASVKDIAAFKKEFGFRIFGGDKTWVAPEKEWPGKMPPLDLDAGRYALSEKAGVWIMTSPVCRETGLQIVRRVRLSPDGTVHLAEELWNRTGRPVKKGVWNVTQIPRPFDAWLAADADAIRSYYHEDPTLPDPGFSLENDNGWVKVPCRSSVCFKFGGIPNRGQIVVVRPSGKGRIVFARSFDLDRTAEYAHRSAVEVFNSSSFEYGEVEVHAPFGVIPPGGSAALRQVWKLSFLDRETPMAKAMEAWTV